MGRPRVIIDWDEVGEMLKCGCDATSIAAALGISTDTLYTRSQKDNKQDFSAFSQQKKALGNDLLRRKQFELAMGGNVSMLIWLGKNRLAQSDKQEVKTQINTAESDESFMQLFQHAKRIFVALDLDKKGVGFDPHNPTHQDGIRTSIARSIAVQKQLFPAEDNKYSGWEDKYERVKEVVWNTND